MPVIHVKFRDRPEVQTSRFGKLSVGLDRILLTSVNTYVDRNTPYIEETGCDFDGDIFFNPAGEVYFDACDRIVIDNAKDKRSVVIFDREDLSSSLI